MLKTKKIILESHLTNTIKGEFSSHDEAYFSVRLGDKNTKKIWGTISKGDAHKLTLLNDDEIEKQLQSRRQFPKVYYSFSTDIFEAIRKLALT